MAMFGGGNGNRAPSFSSLVDRVKTRAYSGEQELVELLNQIFHHPEARPKKLVWMLGSPNPTVREKSIGMITQIAGRSACDILIQAMAGAGEQTRRALAKELVRMDDQQVQRAIGALSASKEDAERRLALEVVSAHPRKFHFLTLLKRSLADPDSAVRAAATKILARGAKNPTVRMILLGLVHSEDAKVRRRAIEALADHPDVDLVEPFFAQMPYVEAVERTKMIDTLSMLALDPNANMEEQVLPVLADEKAEMRDAAVRLLANMPNRTRVLRAYFLHSKGLATWLRSRTAASILKLSDSLVQPLSELLGDPDNDVRVGAMLMISESNDRSFIPLVVRIFQSDLDWWIRSIAVDVLAKHPSPEILEMLLAERHDPDLRYSILSALGKIEAPKALHPLLESLHDSSRGIRIAALDALANKPTEEVVQRVFSVARDDEDRKVQEKAAAVLQEFDGISRPYTEELARLERQARVADDLDCGLSMVNEDLND